MDAGRVVNAVGYIRVSTNGQETNGAGLDAQVTAITSECEKRGWNLIGIEQDVASGGKAWDKRDGLARAVAFLDAGEADVLMSSKLDRLSRSTYDFAALMERAATSKTRWKIVVLDIGVDTSSPHGELLASMLAAMAQWERRMISQRTKDALAEKRKQGVKLGRPRYAVVSDGIIDQIIYARETGMNNSQIAKVLNSEGIPGPGGGKWHWPSVQRVLDRAEIG